MLPLRPRPMTLLKLCPMKWTARKKLVRKQWPTLT